MKKSLSIVVPCFNEEDSVRGTYDVLKNLCLGWKGKLISDYELLFVNDGSTDKTLDLLLALHKENQQVTVLDLRKNAGFQGAITAGLYEAKGEMLVTIDADLQDDPEKIAEMIEKHYGGFDMVLGVRDNRDSDSFSKRFFAQNYYRIIRKLGVKSVYNHGDFRLLSREIVEELKKFPEHVRYLRSLIFEVESKYACVYYKRVSRKQGASKFTFSKSLSLAVDGITSFTSRPIRLLSILGILMFVLSILGAVVISMQKFYWHIGVPGWASLAVVILFLGGLQNLSIGIIGEYIAQIYTENKSRPPYLIRRKYVHE